MSRKIGRVLSIDIMQHAGARESGRFCHNRPSVIVDGFREILKQSVKFHEISRKFHYNEISCMTPTGVMYLYLYSTVV